MKTQRCLFLAFTLLSASLAPGSARAQSEQWLKYIFTSEPKAYRWIELSTNAPTGVALPQLQAGALFGCWTNELDARGRWFALDRSVKTGLQNRFFIDRNGDGRLADEAPLVASVRDENSATFAPVKLVFKGEDGPLSYHVIPQLYQLEKDRIQLLLGSGCCYEGTVSLGAKKQRVQLIDQNVNGVFNDLGDEPRNGDRISFLNTEEPDRFLGQYIEFEKQLFALEVARDGAFVKIKPAADVRLGKVRVPEDLVQLVAAGKMGHFIRKPDQGECTLPLGKYRVEGWRIERKDAQGSKWFLSGYGFGPRANFEVVPDAPAVLKPGDPIRTQLSASETKGQFAFSLRMLGSLGESVEIYKGETRPRAPQLLLTSSEGTFRSTNTFEYG
jgi:hypothetical protein